MKKLLFIAIITIVSFGAGWLAHDVKSEFAYSDNKNQHSVTEIIPYINHRIPKENLAACYEFNGQTVGDVLASVIDLNRVNNKIIESSFQCLDIP